MSTGDDVELTEASEPVQSARTKGRAPRPVVPVDTTDLAPQRRTFTVLEVILLVTVFSLGTGFAVMLWVVTHNGSTPSPAGAYDPRFVAVGKAYLPELGKAYAAAWEDGAKILDSGQTQAMSLEAVEKAWDANRLAAGRKRLTPEFSKVLPETKEEKDISTDDRASLAKAYRGLAKGLSGK